MFLEFNPLKLMNQAQAAINELLPDKTFNSSRLSELILF